MSPTKRRGGSENRLNSLGFGDTEGTNSSEPIECPESVPPAEYKDDFDLPEPEPEVLGFKNPRDERIFSINLSRLSDDKYLSTIKSEKRRLASLKQLIKETDELAKKGNALAARKLALLLRNLRFTEIINISDEYKELIKCALAQ